MSNYTNTHGENGTKVGPLGKEYNKLHDQRKPVLDEARKCAKLTDPAILPDTDQTSHEELPEPHQSIGSMAATHMTGQMMQALFPPGDPWFFFMLNPRLLFDPSIPVERKQAAADALHQLQMQAQRHLDTAGMGAESRKLRPSFRGRKNVSIKQLLVTGDTLEQMTKDYRIKVFRRDQYVVQRDSETNLVLVGTKEYVDPLALGEERRARADVEDIIQKADTTMDRYVPMFTRSAWNPETKTWVIEQEINGNAIGDPYEEQISQYFSTPFQVLPGEHYGRGLIAMHKGDLTSLDSLRQHMLEVASQAARTIPVVDPSMAGFDPEDMDPEVTANGTPLEGRVVNGQVQGVGYVRVDKLPDMQFVGSLVQQLEQSLGQSLLIRSASVRDSERTTAYEIASVTIRQLEGSLGGVYGPIADQMQLPVVRKVVDYMMQNGDIEEFNMDIVDITTTTGIAALSRETRAQRIREMLAEAAQIPEAAAMVNQQIAFKELVRAKNIDVPGIIKSDEQIAQEQAAAQQAAAQAQVAQQAIETGGAVVQSQLTQPQQ